MEHVAGVLKELRAGAAGLARCPEEAGAEAEAPECESVGEGGGGSGGGGTGGVKGEAVRALRREIADIAGSLADTAANVEG